MRTLIRVAGLVLLAVGLASVVIAMTFCTAPKGRGIVWLRGSLQRPDHYTKVGWRLYRGGLAVAVLGLLVAVIAGD